MADLFFKKPPMRGTARATGCAFGSDGAGNGIASPVRYPIASPIVQDVIIAISAGIVVSSDTGERDLRRLARVRLHSNMIGSAGDKRSRV